MANASSTVPFPEAERAALSPWEWLMFGFGGWLVVSLLLCGLTYLSRWQQRGKQRRRSR